MAQSLRTVLSLTLDSAYVNGGALDMPVDVDEWVNISVDVPATGGGSVVIDPVALGIGTSYGILIVAPADILIKPTNLSSPFQGRVFLLASGSPADIMPAPGAETYTLSGVAATVTNVRVIVWGT